MIMFAKPRRNRIAQSKLILMAFDFQIIVVNHADYVVLQQQQLQLQLHRQQPQNRKFRQNLEHVLILQQHALIGLIIAIF
jgi:hypothetical protein